ncbi:MAG: T9SS type A sorting domain-containing protein, partial [Candidatus Kapabacteria bacterium]|nr:T9SS type A sorting domain-containing protein [Candidatus Kapabacteria bacterium]
MVNSKGEMVFIGSNPVKNTSGMSVKSDTGWTTQILYAPFTATGAIPFSGRVVMDSANTYWVTLNDVCFRILNGKNVIQRRDSSTGLDASKVHIPYGCDSAGTVWVTSKDVSKFWISFYKDSTWYDIKGPDTSKRKWIGTVMDKMGRTWILRDDALFMCNSKQWFSYDVSDLPLSSGYVFGIAIDTNMNLWIITSSHKLYAVNPNGLSGVPLGPVVLTTSVNEEPDADVGALSLSPNPASDFVKYHVKPDVVRGYITIHDYTGRIVKNVPLTMLQGEITTDDLVNGVYMFR